MMNYPSQAGPSRSPVRTFAHLPGSSGAHVTQSQHSPAKSQRSSTHGRRASSSRSSYHPGSKQQPEPPSSPPPARQHMFVVRALFDYEASDPSALSFRQDDLIEVLSTLGSGWWDGIIGGKRGWFPSNYVEEVDPGELEDLHAREETEEREGPERRGEADDVDILDLMGRDPDGDGGLEALAREMMRSNDDEDGLAGDFGGGTGDGYAFSRAARERVAAAGDSPRQALAPDFGPPRPSLPERDREETEETIKGSTSSRGLPAASLKRAVNELSHQRLPSLTNSVASADAWVPSMTPDGQIFYQNTVTGEESWELPVTTPGMESSEYFGGRSQEDFFATFSPSDNAAATFSDQPAIEYPEEAAGFGVPPSKIPGGLPHPWVAKLSDDGREWVYFNRLTGLTRRDLPAETNATIKSLQRLSVASSSRSQPSPAARRSSEIRRNDIIDWEMRTAAALHDLTVPPGRPNMSNLLDNVNEALREVFEAAVAGSAAEEEIARASELQSDGGLATAQLREDSAIEMLASAHTAVLVAVREMYASFGYAGPLLGEKSSDMVRPTWAGDMTVIGTIGLLSSTVHNAAVARSPTQSGLSVWADVMRAAGRVKDVLASWPAKVFPGMSANVVDATQGRQMAAWLSLGQVTVPYEGRWGYGPPTADTRGLNQALVSDASALKERLLAALAVEEQPWSLGFLRSLSHFRNLVSAVDIATYLDFDGQLSSAQGSPEVVKVYAELTETARQALKQFDESVSSLTDTMADSVLVPSAPGLGERITLAVDLAFHTLSTLLYVSHEQSEAVSKGLVRGQIGARSYLMRLAQIRPGSLISSESAGSKLTQMRSKGMEEEFLDEDGEREVFDTQSPGASTSSLALSGSMGRFAGSKIPLKSAGSSTTSLGSEGISAKERGHRRSIMDFMRGKSSEADSDARPRGQSKKLAKLLGEDLPFVTTVPPPLNTLPEKPDRPWYLAEDYNPADIVFDERGAVKAGTLQALVIRLTPHGSTDTSFFQAFLLTFRAFTTGRELLELLIQRFNILPPDGMDEREEVDWQRQKQTPIRLRVSNTIRSWLDTHYAPDDADCFTPIEEFVLAGTREGGQVPLMKQILESVKRRREGTGHNARRIFSAAALPPPPILPPKMPTGRHSIRLGDIQPLELARQLTLLEFSYFQKIKPDECLNKAWSAADGENRAPNVRSVIHLANVLSGWVVSHILSSHESKIRSGYVKYFVQVALELQTLNNFSSLVAIVSGLNTSAISRLKRTFAELSPKTLSLKAEIDKSMDSTKNFQHYKDLLKTINPPCVPFFGFWLSALTFIEDGNKDVVYTGSLNTSTIGKSSGMLSNSTSNTSLASRSTAEETGQPLINFFKRSLSAEILRDIQQYQSQPYNLAKCEPVYQFIERGLKETNKRTMDELYNLSLELEPRDGALGAGARDFEAERIQKMLQDSMAKPVWPMRKSTAPSPLALRKTATSSSLVTVATTGTTGTTGTANTGSSAGSGSSGGASRSSVTAEMAKRFMEKRKQEDMWAAYGGSYFKVKEP